MNVASRFVASCAFGLLLTANPARAQSCTDIQSGLLRAADGVTVLTTGFDEFGYNYQARMFNGPYDCYARSAAACAAADPDQALLMKWNDAWLSNQDCTGDGQLDRHLGFPSYAGSGAWITNHQSGVVWVNGKLRRWTYFVKIVAVPTDAVLSGGTYYTAQGERLGAALWGPFAVVEEIYDDPSQGVHGLLYKAAVPPGFGTFQP
jgi:hypothetical protein